MEYNLYDYISHLKKHSITPNQYFFLVDKPWVVSNGTESSEKLIFRTDGRVHISLNGSVRNGHWEYLADARSLLIDYDDMKKLYSCEYIDEAVFVLQSDDPDGDEKYILLVNQNAIPDLDPSSYLRDKYKQKSNIQTVILDDGKSFEIYKETFNPHSIMYSRAKIDGSPVRDGSYVYNDGTSKFVVISGRIVDLKRKVTYSNEVSVWQSDKLPAVGDKAEGLWKGALKVKNKSTYKVYVKNGRVSKIKNHTAYNLLLIGFSIALAFIILTFYS